MFHVEVGTQSKGAQEFIAVVVRRTQLTTSTARDGLGVRRILMSLSQGHPKEVPLGRKSDLRVIGELQPRA